MRIAAKQKTLERVERKDQPQTISNCGASVRSRTRPRESKVRAEGLSMMPPQRSKASSPLVKRRMVSYSSDNKKNARLEKDLRKIQDALQKLAKSEPDVRTQVSSARQKADEARASLSTSQNQSSVLKGLLRLNDSGRIEGFHGRLDNLGAIDERFDVAISTACPALENMVVDTVESGQQCIEHLRKNNLGRANFICLNKLAQRDLSSIQTAGKRTSIVRLDQAKRQKVCTCIL